MRPLLHLSLRYIKNRLAELYYHKTRPDDPWLTLDANKILASYLKQTDIGLEFGSGRSTVWLAKRIRHLTSVEHDKNWYQKVEQWLGKAKLDNVDYHWIPKDVSWSEGNQAAYVRIVDRFENNSLDFVLVDGKYRAFCVFNALEKLRPGGVMIIDDVNLYLPCESSSPNSRTLAQGPLDQSWEQVNRSLVAFRRIWTSSGVKDTGLFFKPHIKRHKDAQKKP